MLFLRAALILIPATLFGFGVSLARLIGPSFIGSMKTVLTLLGFLDPIQTFRDTFLLKPTEVLIRRAFGRSMPRQKNSLKRYISVPMSTSAAFAITAMRGPTRIQLWE